MAHRRRKEHIGSLKVERPLTVSPFLFFHDWGVTLDTFCGKGPDQLSLFSLNNFS